MIILDAKEVKEALQKINKDTSQEEQRKVVRRHALSDGWWDSPWECGSQSVNRNIVSALQRDCLCRIVEAICGGEDKIGIGIGGCPRIKYAYELNIQANPDIFADARYMPFLDNSIDYEISTHVLEHVQGNLFDILTEWIRVLKPEGLLAITLPDKKFFAHDNANPNHKSWDLAPNEITAEELKPILDKLENVKILQFNTNNNNLDVDILIKKI